MSDLDLTRIPRRNDELVVRTGAEMDGEDGDAGEIYICSDDGDTLFVLSGVGADLWTACDGTRTLDDIVGVLLDDYEVERNQLLTDLAPFLSDLEQRRILLFG